MRQINADTNHQMFLSLVLKQAKGMFYIVCHMLNAKLVMKQLHCVPLVSSSEISRQLRNPHIHLWTSYEIQLTPS